MRKQILIKHEIIKWTESIWTQQTEILNLILIDHEENLFLKLFYIW